MKAIRIAILAITLPSMATLFTSPASAQSPDASFASEAASSEAVEVKLAQLAQEKSLNDIVIDFGQRLEDDYTDATDRLSEAASEENISIPPRVAEDGHNAYDRLSKLFDMEFDRAYIKIVVQDHQTEVSNFKKEAETGQNPSLKQFASEMLPTIQQSLEMAQEIQKAMSNERPFSAEVSEDEY